MSFAFEELPQSPQSPSYACDANAWWLGATVQQVHLRSFLDAAGDGIGVLPRTVARLDYISSLGVDAAWISPFFRSPMADFGYDIADFRLSIRFVDLSWISIAWSRGRMVYSKADWCVSADARDKDSVAFFEFDDR